MRNDLGVGEDSVPVAVVEVIVRVDDVDEVLSPKLALDDRSKLFGEGRNFPRIDDDDPFLGRDSNSLIGVDSAAFDDENTVTESFELDGHLINSPCEGPEQAKRQTKNYYSTWHHFDLLQRQTSRICKCHAEGAHQTSLYIPL